jgi:hypothetical protein
MKNPKNKHNQLKLILIPTIFVVAFYTFSALLGNTQLCFFKIVYGVPCPGCGLTRSFLYLFEGNISKALYSHPLFWLIILIFILLVLRIFGLFRDLLKNNTFWLIIVIIFVTVWIIRMLLMFPNKAPLDYYHGSVLSRIISLF